MRRLLGMVPSGLVFHVRRALGPPRWLATGEAARLDRNRPSCVVAAIARPERFVQDLVADGWMVVDAVTFRDHHRFDRKDVERIAQARVSAGADVMLTTEKDAVRLEGLVPPDLPVAVVPLSVTIEPADFETWLRERLQAARRADPRGKDVVA